MRKKTCLLIPFTLSFFLVFLSACSNSNVSTNSTNFWDRYIVYYFGESIKAFSFGNIGIGIILFTFFIRIILFPLTNFQMKSTLKIQELSPSLKELRLKYYSKDVKTQTKLREEIQNLYKENNVNPYAGCLSLFIQMPILTALWQAISRIPSLQKGSFLWLKLGESDSYYILPFIASFLTFFSIYLTNMTQVDKKSSLKIVNFLMPLIIFLMGINLASGLSLYWVISNTFQILQTLWIHNPFFIRNERKQKIIEIKLQKKILRKYKNQKKKRKK